MKIRALINLGAFHNHVDVKRGDVLEVDDGNARRYINLGYAEPFLETHKEPVVEKAVAPVHETAALKVPPVEKAVPKPVPLDEPDERHKSAEEELPPVKRPVSPVKRRPGR